MALEPVTKELDGSLHYLPPFFVADALYNGVSVLENEPVEIQVWKDGWGFVCVQKQILPAGGAGAGKTQVDGQKRNFTYWGRIQVIDSWPEPSFVFDDPLNSGLVVIL